MIGFRTNITPDISVAEPEQDANSVLTELDKGLRSTKVGEQCEAIVCFPRLFEKYPFPILINSSFLKLADVFRMGNNFLRLWILRVCQQSENHLDKIVNVDEFLRRIFSVLHSNDPVARALALKTLGAVAGIIPERQNVHHAIRRGLDSHDNVEVDAAIYATNRFAAHSNAFAVAMCNKISDMVESENTGAERRDKLVRALRTVHGGAVRAEGVLRLLRSLMERYPSSSFVRSSIIALTSIASDTVVHVPDQVELLLSIAVNDPRASVRRSALTGLNKMAEHAALWPKESVQSLVNTAIARTDMDHTMLCLNIMQSLVKCPAVCATYGSIDGRESSLRSFCSEASLSADLNVASTAARVLSTVVVHCYKENLPVEGADLMMALESLVVATGQTEDSKNLKPLRVALKCLVELSNAEPTVYAARTAILLGSQLTQCNLYEAKKKNEKTRLVSILEALAALGGGTYCPHSIKPAMQSIVEMLDKVGKKERNVAFKMETDQMESSEGTELVLLCTIICQERAGSALRVNINHQWEESVLQAITGVDAWTLYRVARAALRYGHTALASSILDRLTPLAPSESAQRWLSALRKAAQADYRLEQEGISGLDEASAAWELAGDAAGTGAFGVLSGSWCVARAALCSALSYSESAALALCTQPPPAVAQTTREPSMKSGACAIALRKAAKALQAVSQRYIAISRSAFHADESTLRHLQICQHNMALLSQFLENISGAATQKQSNTDINVELPPPQCLEDKIMMKVTDELQRIISSTKERSDKVITHQHAKAIKQAVQTFCTRTVWPLGVFCPRPDDPLCRLSVTPNTRNANEPAATMLVSHHLSVHIEGLIKTPPPLKKKQEQRKVKGVLLTVTVSPHARNNEKNVDVTNTQPILTASQTVTPIRDFFSGQQLVTVPNTGLYSISVTAACIDQHGTFWHHQQPVNTLIKAHEDPTSKTNNQASRRF